MIKVFLVVLLDGDFYVSPDLDSFVQNIVIYKPFKPVTAAYTT